MQNIFIRKIPTGFHTVTGVTRATAAALLFFSCMASSSATCIRATQILAGKVIKPEHVVVIQDGFIQNVEPWGSPVEQTCVQVQELDGLLAPGFVDVHIHGAGGRDVMDIINTPETLKIIGKNLLSEGVTTWLPTTTSAPPKKLENILCKIKQHSSGQNQNDEAHIAGIHMEGPFISKAKSGCHPHDTLLPVNIELLDRWQRASANSIRVVTFAPELDNSRELIEWCKQHNVIASIGHTNATESITQHAIDNGALMGTHLFNAMSQSKSRDAGAAFTILANPQIPFEIIMDGIHLSNTLARLIWKTSRSNPERLVLITDAISAKGLPQNSGYHMLGGNIRVRVEGYKSVLADKPDTLAGSVLTMPYAVETMMRVTGCSLPDALLAASHNPAKSIHLDQQIGLLSPGMKADMVLLTNMPSLTVKHVWRNGKLVI